MKFMQLILWPGGAYTLTTQDATTAHNHDPRYYDYDFMNHNYIGSLWQCQMSHLMTGLALNYSPLEAPLTQSLEFDCAVLI